MDLSAIFRSNLATWILIPSRIFFTFKSTASCLLPLRFSWHSHIYPRTIRLCTVPTYFHNRVIPIIVLRLPFLAALEDQHVTIFSIQPRDSIYTLEVDRRLLCALQNLISFLNSTLISSHRCNKLYDLCFQFISQETIRG